MDKLQFVSELSKLRPASTFLTLKGYCNEYSEVADYNLVFHMSYKNALERSIATLNSLKLISDVEKEARTELLTSFRSSLTKLEFTPMEELEDAYTHFFEDGVPIKGIKLHTATGILHLYGLIVGKRVTMPGLYPIKNKRPFTIVKDKLRHLTSVGKFRQFRIQATQVDMICVENLSLLPPQ